MVCAPEDTQRQSLSWRLLTLHLLQQLGKGLGCSRGAAPFQGSLHDPQWVVLVMVTMLSEGLTVKTHLHAVLGCHRVHTWSFPLLQFLGLPVIDMLNDGE